jgi:hypothetical protein
VRGDAEELEFLLGGVTGRAVVHCEGPEDVPGPGKDGS